MLEFKEMGQHEGLEDLEGNESSDGDIGGINSDDD